MRRSIFAVSLVPSVLCLCAALAPEPAPPPCPNVFVHEPVVMYEVSGRTLCCAVDLQMTVWGDGSARVASADDGNGRARVAWVAPSAVQDLIADLGALGAGLACDQPDLTSDVPLSTLTVLRGTTEGRARTWSWLGDDGHGNAIEARLGQFLQDAFPGF